MRHRGTIGGSVAHGDPASDLPAVLLALDATFVAQRPGGRARRSPPASSSRASSRPRSRPTSCSPRSGCPKTGADGFAYQKFNRRAQDWAIVGALAVRVDGATRVALVNMGIDAAARRLRVEAALAARCVDRRRRASTRPRAPSRRRTSTPRPSTASTSPACWSGARSKAPRRPDACGVAAAVLAAGRGCAAPGRRPQAARSSSRGRPLVAWALDAAVARPSCAPSCSWSGPPRRRSRGGRTRGRDGRARAPVATTGSPQLVARGARGARADTRR